MSSEDKFIKREKIQELVRDDSVFGAVSSSSPKVGENVLRDIAWILEKVDGDREKLDSLVDLLMEIECYVIVFDELGKEPTFGKAKAILDKSLRRTGYSLKHCKYFANMCHKLLSCFYDLDITTQDKVVKAVEALNSTAAMSDMMGERSLSERTTKVRESVLRHAIEDLRDSLNQCVNYGMVGVPYEKVDISVM